ncbi:MAG TPA: DUF4384 domain-containing protein [Gemmatimonadales bacterium]|jgi:hypothetical protein
MILALAIALAVQNPVTVQLNHEQYEAGDRARVYVQAAEDGYLVILHADPAGRVRVIFPLDPSDDNFVRGDRKFEVRGRNDRDPIQIEGEDGTGTVLAAVSPDAFRFDEFSRNDHWDFRALGGPSSTVKDDPLAKLLDIVQRMAGDSTGRFDYDQVTYLVQTTRYAANYGGGWGHSHFMIGFSFGYPYYYPFYAAPFGFYGGWGYPYGYRYGGVYSRPVVFGSFGASKTFVKPARPLVTPIEVRPRTIISPSTSSRNRIEPRTTRANSRSIPTMLRGLFGGGRGGGRGSAPSSRASISRGFSRGGWSMPRMAGGGGGFSRGIGGRRH